jgi:hypothetical protein
VFPDRAQQPVSEFTWEELSRLDAGSWFNAKFPDRARPEFASARILRLDQLIDIALASDKPSGLYLETKAPERFPGIEAELIRQLERRGYLSPSLHGKLVFQSFSAASLRSSNSSRPRSHASICSTKRWCAGMALRPWSDKRASLLGRASGRSVTTRIRGTQGERTRRVWWCIPTRSTRAGSCGWDAGLGRTGCLPTAASWR